MKISTSLLLLLLLGLPLSNLSAQGLTPSKVRQVFALERGDSLIYHEWTALRPGPILNQCADTICKAYKLKVVDSVHYDSVLDILTIHFQNTLLSKTIFTQGTGCGDCQDGFVLVDPFSIDSVNWIVKDLDSALIPFLDSTYLRYGAYVHFDTAYSNIASYNGGMQNLLYVAQMPISGGQDIYLDSIGIVHKTEDYEYSQSKSEELIYYHKSNGKTWGTRYVNTGVNDIPGTGYISLYPNPASKKFTLSMEQYQDASFELYDILGKKVMALSLRDKETEVNNTNLPSGIYLWHINKENQPVKTGKLIID